jgi:hypothetical protein
MDVLRGFLVARMRSSQPSPPVSFLMWDFVHFTGVCIPAGEEVKVKVKISLFQAVEAHRVARG